MSEVHTNPNYNNKTFHNDIALIKLSKPIEFGRNVKSACLNFKDEKYDYLYATGYGAVTPEFEDDNGKKIVEQISGDELKYAFFKENKTLGESCLDVFICIDSYFEGSGDSPCMGKC